MRKYFELNVEHSSCIRLTSFCYRVLECKVTPLLPHTSSLSCEEAALIIFAELELYRFFKIYFQSEENM